MDEKPKPDEPSEAEEETGEASPVRAEDEERRRREAHADLMAKIEMSVWGHP